jgi:hypothetical protein
LATVPDHLDEHAADELAAALATQLRTDEEG